MIVLRADKVTRRFGGTLALDAVDFDVHSGAVNVLIGENGAGKSTLMRIFAGVDRPTEGRLLLDGEPVTFASVRDAARQGIGIVHQELNLCPNLTVAENIFLTRSDGLYIDRANEIERARKLLERIGPSIDPAAPVSSLRIGQQQIVEIARALAEDVRVLILDEPTSALSAAEVDVLFAVIDELRSKGTAIIYISHRLEELMRIGDHITILRDGRRVAYAPVAEASVAWIIDNMLGKTGQIERERTSGSDGGEAVLTLRDVDVPAAQGSPRIDIAALDVRAGEVTALYGLLGAGRSELMELVCGLRTGPGKIALKGRDLVGLSVAERVECGVLLVPEDRQRDGLFQNLGVGPNMSLANLTDLSSFGVVSDAKEASAVESMIERLNVKAHSHANPILNLSGGNQQKAVIGRCLMPGPAAILLDEPSRGVDIGARAEIFSTIQSLADEGIAVLFATSDLGEALGASDRIVVMANGRITGDFRAAETDEPALVRAANQSQPDIVGTA